MIKVLIADDQKLFRDLLEHMLRNCDDIEVVATAVNGNDTVQKALECLPDVILMDVLMPELSGIEASVRIKQEGFPSKILMLTASHEDEDVKEALQSGVDGYILKSVGKDELILAVKGVYSGMEIIHKELIHAARSPIASKPDPRQAKNIVRVNNIEIELSERELGIIQMVVEGKSTSEMAQALFLSAGRVRNIITEILLKLMVKDRRELAVWAIKSGLVQ